MKDKPVSNKWVWKAEPEEYFIRIHQKRTLGKEMLRKDKFYKNQ